MAGQETATIICQNCKAQIAAISRFCGVCGTAIATAAPVSPVQQGKGMTDSRRLVTVLFADIAGFTAMSERLDPEDVKHISDDCLTLLADVVARYDGHVDKYMGDNIMVLFGAPTAHEDDPERAILCSIEMHQKLTELSAALEKQRGFSLNLHIGINTGEVLAGAMGNAGAGGDYTVMGDAVNVAARLQDQAHAGETVVGPTTYQLASHAFAFADMGPLKVRGKREPVRAWRVVGPLAERGSGRGLEAVGLSTPFVGRQQELGQLRELLANTAQGRAVVCRLVGEAGAGKSRLIKELRATSAGLRCYTGHCLAYTDRNSSWLLSDLLRGICGLSPSEGGEGGTAAVLGFCASLGLSAAQPSRAAIFCRLLGFPYADATVRALSGADFALLLRDALTEMLAALASSGDGPLLLILEDVHWADLYSLAAIARIPTLPGLMMLFTYRQGHSPALLPAGNDEATIELSAFSAAESEQMVSAALEIEALPNEVAEQIKARGGGNPFFIEELLKLLLQSGAIVNDEGRWRFTADPASFRVPLSVQEVVQGRIDRLSPPQRTMLQHAAVVGRTFSSQLLRRVLPRDAADFDFHLATLDERYLVMPIAALDEEYAFRHTLIQEVAYQSVLQSERRRLHERIAHTLVALHPEQAEQSGVVELIAFHYSQSENDAGAATYLMRAGARAHRLYAMDEATSYYGKAMERQKKLAAADPQQRLRWGVAQLEAYTALVDIATLVGHLDEAEATGAAGVELAAFLLPLAHEADAYREVSAQIAELCVKMAQLYGNRRGQADKTLEYIAIGERALGTEHGRPWAHLQVASAQAYFLRFQPDEMIARIEQVLPILEREHDLPWLALAYFALGTAATFRGGMAQVYRMRKRALDIFEQLGDLRGMLSGYLSNGVVLGDMLQFAAAEKALDKAEELANRLKSRDSLAKAQIWRALIHLAQGELDAAQQYTTQATEMARANGYQSVYLDGLTYTGEVEYARGNFAAALALWQQGLAQSEGKALWVADYQLRMARALARIGRRDEAEAMITAAAQGETNASTMIQTTMLLAEAQTWLGQQREALALVNQALAAEVSSPRNDMLYRMLRVWLLLELGEIATSEAEASVLHAEALQHGLRLEQGISARVIGQARLRLGDKPAAQKWLAEAVQLFTAMGMQAEVAISHAALDQAAISD